MCIHLLFMYLHVIKFMIFFYLNYTTFYHFSNLKKSVISDKVQNKSRNSDVDGNDINDYLQLAPFYHQYMNSVYVIVHFSWPKLFWFSKLHLLKIFLNLAKILLWKDFIKYHHRMLNDQIWKIKGYVICVLF